MRAYNWIFTLNNYTKEEEDVIKQCQRTGVLKWVLYGREIGDSGTPHLQGVCGTPTQCRLSAMRKSVSARAHWEPMRGRVDQASDYCQKDGDIVTWGVVPNRTEEDRSKESTQDKYRKIIEYSKTRNLNAIQAEYPCAYFMHYKRILQLGVYNTEILPPDQKNIWFSGETGTGKSHRARQYPNYYLKKRNKWWDNYNDEDNVIIEEWGPDNVQTANELKIWADRYSFPAEVKGGTIEIRPRQIIVTSNYTLSDCFPDSRDYAALARRFTQIQCISQTDQIVTE